MPDNETMEKLRAMSDEELDRYGKAAAEYARVLDPGSPKMEKTGELLRMIREEKERRLPPVEPEALRTPERSTRPTIEKPAKKKKKHGCLTFVLVVVVAILAIGIIGSLGSDGTDNGENNVDSHQSLSVEENQKEDQKEVPTIVTDIDTTDYLHLDASVLFEYGSYLEGQNVVTVITVSDTGRSEIKANTDNDDSYFFSISCKFNDKEVVKKYDDGDIITVCGTVGEDLVIGSTVTLENCSVIGTGEIAQDLKDETDQQIELCQQYKTAYEEAIAAAFAEEKEAYISDCITVDYTDVARNPDNHKGEKIKITGKVIQVSEGWLNSVTLRIDCNGDIWYVTYTRDDDEARILEDDQITAYGECNGIETYTSVLGSQITIPSMKMKYYT